MFVRMARQAPPKFEIRPARDARGAVIFTVYDTAANKVRARLETLAAARAYVADGRTLVRKPRNV